jgi:hypothetical protein
MQQQNAQHLCALLLFAKRRLQVRVCCRRSKNVWRREGPLTFCNKETIEKPSYSVKQIGQLCFGDEMVDLVK